MTAQSPTAQPRFEDRRARRWRLRWRPSTAVPAAVLLAAAATLLTSPFLRWVRPLTHDEACGWTCYVPLPLGTPMHRFAGEGGWAASAPRQLLGVVVAALAVALALRLVRRPVPPTLWILLAAAAVGAAFVDLRFASTTFDAGDVARLDGDHGGDDRLGPVVAATAAVTALVGLAMALPALVRRGTRRRDGR